MMALRPSCEHCITPLPPDSPNAMICTFECTFCADCVTMILENVCPNCGGGFEKRPVRPKEMLEKYPASAEHVHKPIEMNTYRSRQAKLKNTHPSER